jgi:glycosyltransferase involved in cell wall biosynthesis
MADNRISVVIITKNEEKNIRACLESVKGWADEIIVVDDFSVDRTVELAREFTDKIFQKKMEVEGTHRNWAYSQANNSWILSLDADERLTDELKSEISKVLDQTDNQFSGFTIPRRNYIGDYWIKHGGLYPGAQLRLFKKGKFKYEEVEVHPRAFLDGDCGHLRSDMIHYSYEDFSDFLRKLDAQTTLEAKKWFNTNRNMSFGHALWRTIDRFFRTFLRKKSRKDGFIGFMIAYFASLYQIMSYAKYWEMKRRFGKK